MACCTPRQVRLKKVNTARSTRRANAAIAKGKKAGIQPKKITPAKDGKKPKITKPDTCVPCAKKVKK